MHYTYHSTQISLSLYKYICVCVCVYIYRERETLTFLAFADSHYHVMGFYNRYVYDIYYAQSRLYIIYILL